MLLVLRPKPGLAATLASARALGLNAAGHALSRIIPVAWDAPDPSHIDGLLIGSANVFVHGGSELEAFRDKPVHVVGAATADAARAAGFAVATQGQGGLQKVLNALTPPLRLLRIAGEEHIALNVPHGIAVTTVIAYRSQMLPLDAAVSTLRNRNAITLLHSAATARHFSTECQRLRLDHSDLVIAALAPRIAAAAGDGWRAVHIAPQPDDAALLEMVCDICNDNLY